MTFAAGRRFAFAFSVFLAACPAFAFSFTFSNTNQILINDSISPPTKAATYPSMLSVTGLSGQLIVKATITLNGFTHEYPSDVTMLLIGPSGEKTIVVSETGGQIPLAVTNLTLTLD